MQFYLLPELNSNDTDVLNTNGIIIIIVKE